MAAPVTLGILVANEVIYLLLHVLFYHVRRRRWVRLQGIQVGEYNVLSGFNLAQALSRIGIRQRSTVFVSSDLR